MTDSVAPGLGIPDLIGEKRAQLIALAGRHGATHVRIFGSVARGEATPESDVDVLVSFPPDRSIFDLIGLWLEMQDLLGREVSLITEDLDDPQFMQVVQAEAVPL
jgi:predicted nucleotidyltransferase